jgi:hypothetical protein
MQNKIQLKEYSMSGGMDGVLCILRNSNGNRYILYLYFNDRDWNWNYNWLDNDWNRNNPSALLAILFLLPPLNWAVFFI